jgi:hypothetical protein
MSGFTIEKDGNRHILKPIDPSHTDKVYVTDVSHYYSSGFYFQFQFDDNNNAIIDPIPFLYDKGTDQEKIDSLRKLLQEMSEPIHLIIRDDIDYLDEAMPVLPEPAIAVAQEQIIIDRPSVPKIEVFVDESEPIVDESFDEFDALFEQFGAVVAEEIEFGSMKFSEINVNDMIKFLPNLYPNMDAIVAEKYANIILGLVRSHSRKNITIGQKLLENSGLPEWIVPIVSAVLKEKIPAILNEEETGKKKEFFIPVKPFLFSDRLAERGYEANVDTSKPYIPYHVKEPSENIDHIDSTGMTDIENTPLSWLNCRQDYTINVVQKNAEGLFIRRTYGEESDLNVILYTDFLTGGNTRAQSIADKGAIKSVTCKHVAPGDTVNIIGFLQRPVGITAQVPIEDDSQIHPIKTGYELHQIITEFYPTPEGVLDLHPNVVAGARNMTAIKKLLKQYKYDETDLTVNSIDRDKWNIKFGKVARWPQNITMYYTSRPVVSHDAGKFVVDYKYLPTNIEKDQLLIHLNSAYDYGTVYHLLRMQENSTNKLELVNELQASEVTKSTDPVYNYTLESGKIAYKDKADKDDQSDRGYYYTMKVFVF